MTLPANRQQRPTEARHHALVHHLPADEATLPADAAWVTARIHRYALAVGVDPVVAFTDATGYGTATGRPVPPSCWGQADWGTSRRLVYVAPAKCGTRAVAELVTAHEIGHLRWPATRHSTRFFSHVQTLLDSQQRVCDIAAVGGTGGSHPPVRTLASAPLPWVTDDCPTS